MKGGSKFKLKTGTIGKLPLKRPNLPAELFNMKELPPSGEEEEEEAAEENEEDDKECATIPETDSEESGASMSLESTRSGQPRRQPARSQELKEQSHKRRGGEESAEAAQQDVASSSPESKAGGDGASAAQPSPRKNVKKKVMGPSRPPRQPSGEYPEDDPDYCVWVPPTDQTGDGRTHLNDKYGY